MATLKSLIGEDVSACEIEYRTHATRRMFQRGIFNEDVENVLAHGEVIEEYEEAPPFERLLINGRTCFGQPLHVAVVVDTSERRLSIITTYEPDRHRWTDNYSRRR